MIDGLTEEQRIVDIEVQKQVPMVLGLPEPDRSKCLMCLAYEYFNQDMEEKAFKLLEQSDPDYFKDQLASDMKNDPDIARIVMTILTSLVGSGYVDLKAMDEGEK